MWKDCHWRGTPSRKRVGRKALGVRLPLLRLFWRHGRVRQGSALLARRRREPLAGSNPAASASAPRSSADSEQWVSAPRAPVRIGPGCPCARCDVVQRQDDRLLPGECWFDPSRRSLSFVPRSSSSVEDSGLSHRRRGFESRSGHLLEHMLSDASGICGPAVSRVRRVRFPSRALLAVAQWMSAALLPRAMEVRVLPASCVARLVASPRAVNPWSRVRFPGDAPSERLLRRRAGWASAALIRRS